MSNWLYRAAVPESSVLPQLEVPRRFVGGDLKAIPSASLRDAVTRYGANFWEHGAAGRAPLFVGAAQTYKTFAAAVLAQRIHELARVPVGWCRCAAELVQFDRAAFHDHTQARIQHLKTVPYLVMDDFTQVVRSPRQVEILVEIGTFRFDEQLPTCWTGNITLSKSDQSELTKAVGACLARRILEASEGYRVMTKAAKATE